MEENQIQTDLETSVAQPDEPTLVENSKAEAIEEVVSTSEQLQEEGQSFEAEIAEEKRLQYVMCTRPKESLNFVTEKDIRPNNAYSENNSFYDELLSIKNEIQTWEK